MIFFIQVLIIFDFSVLTAIPENSHTNSATLNKLADDEFSSVRYSVAENPNTSTKILAKLAKDNISTVRDSAQYALSKRIQN